VLVAVCHVYFEREAYTKFEYSSGGEVSDRLRLTFDSNVTALFPYENQCTDELMLRRNVLEDEWGEKSILLEVKHDSEDFPEIIHDELQTIGTQRSSFSKYGQSMELLMKQNECY